MQVSVGLDVQQILSHPRAVDPYGKQFWRGKGSTDPDILAETIEACAGPAAKRAMHMPSWRRGCQQE